MAKLSLDDRLNQIEDKISEKSFRENKGLGNEVGYYIFDYDPREENRHTDSYQHSILQKRLWIEAPLCSILMLKRQQELIRCGLM